ncbi:YolD-like family protein [Bacillus sp. FJAT-49732]|uniref:YolD-like family protein n=1 Tax=Lederbergia citrisecunda TaxID=2833583 RepID=A0A942TLY8_9BACI|nr:YolD-like family protein [Lederbergia citrisecunda]
MHTALEFHSLVCVTNWVNGFTDKIEGFIHYADLINKQIRIKDIEENVHRITLESIINIQIK